jgi:hypothetical protein
MTQHRATASQLADRLVETDEEVKAEIAQLLTIEEYPSTEELESRAQHIAKLAVSCISRQTPDASEGWSVMIGGAPYLMSHLEASLKAIDIEVCYAFTKRVAVEKAREDGTVEKLSVFKHGGYVFV